jgi:putative protease
LLAAGLRRFRVELLDEDANDARTLVTTYLDLLAGRVPADEVFRRLRVQNQLGVTGGTLER